MGEKGERTKKMIREQAAALFAQKGFSMVTMKDICEATGLSRGGLYRHYENTAGIFEEIFLEMATENENLIDRRIKEQIPAMEILKEEMKFLKEEMLNSEQSLSYPIYEYANTVSRDLFEKLNEQGYQKWERLMAYGVSRGEFRKENTAAVITMILYAYQGIRMWSRVINIPEQAAEDYENCIIQLLQNGCRTAGTK
ncbi:MAG: TetR/AcrR family transcriptional regulator [bacterium]|nr:TetR/AcrR family transcriptional regulator [bacterium]